MVQTYLLEDVPKVGVRGEIVEVKPGFARNYLCRFNKAVLVGEGEYRKQLPILYQRPVDTSHRKITANMIAAEMEKWLNYKVPVCFLKYKWFLQSNPRIQDAREYLAALRSSKDSALVEVDEKVKSEGNLVVNGNDSATAK